jgi:hypothetical protein
VPTIAETFPSLQRVALSSGTEDVADLLSSTFDPTDRLCLLRVATFVRTMCREKPVMLDEAVAAATSLLEEIDGVAEPGDWSHDLLTFATCAFLAAELQHRGEAVGPSIFIQRALRCAQDDGGFGARPERLRLWESPPVDALDLAMLELTLTFFATLYAHAWRHTDQQDLAMAVWPHAIDATLAALGVASEELEGLDDDAPLMWAVACAVHRLQWAIGARRDEAAQEFAEVWEPLLDDSTVGPTSRKALLMFGSSVDGLIASRPPKEYAEMLLAEFGHELTPPLRLRAVTASFGGDVAALREGLGDLLDAAAAHRAWDHPEEPPSARAYRRSMDYVAIAWPVRSLVNDCHVDEALTLLAAWAVKPPTLPLLREPLFMLPTSVVGTQWATSTVRAPGLDARRPATLPALNQAIERSFRTSYEVQEGASWDVPPSRTGFPVEDEGGAYLAVCTEHLRLADLAAVAAGLTDAASIVPWPMIRLPLQALIRRDLGRTWPLSASLEEPRPAAAIRQVAVLGVGSITSEHERRAVAEAFTREGVEVVDFGEATRSSFSEAYTSSFELVWLCSHGSLDHVRPHLSGLPMDDGDYMTADELEALPVPSRDTRRLVVLNVCDGGASPLAEGALAQGVAARLASRQQAVVSHLWPIKPIAASAFAGVFAGELARANDALAAFTRALAAMHGGQAPLADALTDLRAEELAALVAHNDIGWESAFTWGAPVLVG